MTKPVYEDYAKLIARIAWRFVCCYGFEIDELMSEGYIVFSRCVDNWQAKQGCFSTYLYANVQGRFKYLLRSKDRKQPSREYVDGVTPDNSPGPEWRVVFKRSLQELSADAQFCIKVIWDTPAELYGWIIDEKTHPMITIKLLSRYLNKSIGWPYSKIGKCFDEIRQVL